ncbi:MAG: hypothetical protein AAF318_06690 [Pseudomonadota bacterium]
MADLMIASVYDALKDAGASEEKARAAAVDVAGHDNRLASMERKLDGVADRLGRKLDAIDAKLDQLAANLSARIDNLETKLDGLSQRMNIQFGLLVAMFTAILVRSFI